MFYWFLALWFLGSVPMHYAASEIARRNGRQYRPATFLAVRVLWPFIVVYIVAEQFRGSK